MRPRMRSPLWPQLYQKLLLRTDEENEFDSKEFKEEYEKIYRDAVAYTTHTCC